MKIKRPKGIAGSLGGKKYTFGTERKRTELDNILDKIILKNYYKTHKEKRTPEGDREILRRSYLKPVN